MLNFIRIARVILAVKNRNCDCILKSNILWWCHLVVQKGSWTRTRIHHYIPSAIQRSQKYSKAC